MKQTIENLARAFIGESQARNRYTFYAKVAKKEGAFSNILDDLLDKKFDQPLFKTDCKFCEEKE